MHPSCGLYLPGPHCRQALMLENEYEPVSHRLQLELPFLSLKLPAGHGVQETAPSSAKNPG
jgi:hypothetical protein